jgi:hypothetical protein
MSVLSFPRIYFKGYIEWDPCTFNNNDWLQFPTYDAAYAALNWSFLASQGQVPPGITPDNYATTFRPWAIALQNDTGDSPSGPRIPAEWNMFGGHGVSFVQYEDMVTTITGGDIGYNSPVPNDPLIGEPVYLGGDTGRNTPNPGRLVDTNPLSFWSSQIYFGQLAFGGGVNSFGGPRAYRMHSRWLNPNRIYNAGQVLTAPASAIGVCFQTCIPNNEITWPTAGTSQLVAALQQASEPPGALGIMMRFTAYVNLYFMNGIFNANPQQPRDYTALASALKTAWEAWNSSGDPSQFFTNPCYSNVVGAIGVWNEGELATVPGGRCLAANVPVAPASSTNASATEVTQQELIVGHELKASAVATTGDPVPLGPVAVYVDLSASVISLDFSGTIPENGTVNEWPSDLSKVDFGPLTLGVVTGGTFEPFATIAYDQYNQAAYEASAGIIDIPFSANNAATLLQGASSLAIQAQGQVALLEQTSTAETDQRGIYLDQNEETEFSVMVCQMGVPAPGVNLLVAQYDSGLNLLPSNHVPFVSFTNGNPTTITVPGDSPTITTNVTVLTTDENGLAAVGIAAQGPGFPVLAFFPFSSGTLPQPPISFDVTDDAFYTTVRVLPFDDGLPAAFVNLWNGAQNQAQAWAFVYGQVLYLYDMLFNVMLEFVNLGNQQAVEGSISYIWPLISKEAAVESTMAMPVTRDMSAGKRLTLQLWIYLVANNYNVPNFNVGSIPAGWTPPS